MSKITIDRAVLEMALAALKKCDFALSEELAAWDIDPPLHHVLEASTSCGPSIAALQAALAQQPAQQQEPSEAIEGQRRLVEILAENWRVWPARKAVQQTSLGDVYCSAKGRDLMFGNHEIASDQDSAVVTKEMWSALRGALAQPQPEPAWWPAVENILDEYGLQAIDFVADFKAALAQPQQEPVAWKHDCAALLMNGVELWVDHCPHCGKPRTSPPARKPLTDELIIGWVESGEYNVTTNDWASHIAFARAIEAAHGIKEMP